MIDARPNVNGAEESAANNLSEMGGHKVPLRSVLIVRYNPSQVFRAEAFVNVHVRERITDTDAARYWGFENVSRFSRTYRALYGNSPAGMLGP